MVGNKKSLCSENNVIDRCLAAGIMWKESACSSKVRSSRLESKPSHLENSPNSYHLKLKVLVTLFQKLKKYG